MNEYYAAVIKTKTVYDSPLLSTRDKFQSQSMPETKPYSNPSQFLKPNSIHIDALPKNQTHGRHSVKFDK